MSEPQPDPNFGPSPIGGGRYPTSKRMRSIRIGVPRIEMDFISFISKMTALGCDVLFIPSDFKGIRMRVRTVEREPLWTIEIHIKPDELTNPTALGYRLGEMERRVMAKLDELALAP